MSSNSAFREIWLKLAGDNSRFHNIHVAVNSICVISFVLLFILMVSNMIIGLTYAALMMSVLLVLSSVLYYFSRIKGAYKPVIWIYTVVSYFALTFNYFFNFGINGPTSFGFFLTFLLLVAIVPRKYHLLIALAHASLLISLFVFEYLFPERVSAKYTSDLTRIIDWSVAYIVCAGFMSLIVMFLRDNYKREKILARQQALDISRQNEELKSLMAEKNKLFSLISHDMAAPLSLIQGYLELIAEAPVEQEAGLKRELLNLTKRTSDMLNNMLTWSKSQMEGISVELEAVDVGGIIREKLPLYSSIAEAKDITIDVSGCRSMIVIADEQMTKAIVRNLVSNAIKFTPSGGRISVSTEETDTYCYVHVTDTGIGMSEEKQEDLFKLRSKATYGTENEAGVGLGLVLCREFAHLQGGEIMVISTENVGSTFTIKLPGAKQQDC